MFRTKLQRIKTKRERERERERERKKKDTNELYRFLPQTGSSHVPLALPRRVHYNVISDYKCSSLNLARDFKCSSKLQETSYAPEHNQETSMLKHKSKRLLIKQNYKEKCLTLNT